MVVVGHNEIVEGLKTLADKEALGHAYCFTGPCRVGKRTSAWALAYAFEHGGFPVEAQDERRVLQDAQILAPDEVGTLGIDLVREARGFLSVAPAASVQRVLIVDGADRMTTEAQNAFLKIAEEPPPHALILIIAEDPDALLPTLRSRIREIYFAPLSRGALAAWLQKEEKLPAVKAKELAAKSGGIPGLAKAMLRDEKFQTELSRAEAFLKTSPAGRRAFITELLEDETFNLDAFLEAVMIVLGPPREGRFPFWHACLRLRRDARAVPVNPKLQLAALAAHLSS